MSRKTNISEEAPLSPMIWEPDSDEDICDTTLHLQGMDVTEDEPSIDESDITDKVCPDSKDTQYYVTHPNTEGASNDAIKSDEMPLYASSEGLLPIDNKRRITIWNNEVYVEITKMLPTIQEDSPTYDCSNLTVDESQKCETVIKQHTFSVKHESLVDANPALEQVEHSLSSESSYSRH
ncbi:hypothetical protein TNCT_36591 [Trichonephila clavata]|uniref:Uncharacterized protein n=1 Tax=Trichonephila clavata TaxID=2740835 RepID=A0A8X6FPV0_TRICU|nr:hypothetical protein TNCT_36591 [Trichonephila clavata]